MDLRLLEKSEGFCKKTIKFSILNNAGNRDTKGNTFLTPPQKDARILLTGRLIFIRTSA